MVKFKFGSKDSTNGIKSRAVIFFIALIVVVGLIIGYLLYKKHVGGVVSGANISGAPGIESVPGVGSTSTEYVKLQEQQNIQQAQEAEAKGTSAVPTITRTSYFGPSEFQAPSGAARPGCTPDDLRKARAAGVTADELRCKGCSLAELKAAGYTAGELAAAGFNANDLRNAGYTPDELRQAGFNPSELKQAGFNAQQLASGGYSPGSLAQAGFSAKELSGAGYSPDAIAALVGGTPSNMPKDCSIAALKRAHDQGVPAAALKKMGCGAAALRAAGYTAAQLRAAGFTPEELRAAGFTPAELRAAGLTAGQLRRAGFNANDLKNAGFDPSALRGAGFGANALKNAGFGPDDLKRAGYTPGDLLRAGYNPGDAFQGVGGPANCSVDALRQARAQGVSAAELKNRGCSAAAMLAAGYTPAELKAAGYGDDDLRAAGLTPAQIAAANALLSNQCSVAALRQARAQGVSAAELKKRGCSAAAMLAAGYTPAELKAAGYSDADLRAAGLTPAQIEGTNAQIANQCNIDALRRARAQGVSAADLKKRGCSAAALLAAGYTPAELKAAGYSDDELRAAGVPIPTTGIAGSANIPPVGNSEIQLAQLQSKQEQQVNAQQREQRLAQVQSSMVSQANSLFSTWTPPAPQQYVVGETPKDQSGEASTTTAGATASTTKGVSSVTTKTATTAGGETSAQCAYVKGGDIMMAVLTSTVNSDENSPVMARIVSGKLRGAQLIGQFTLLKKTVLISFNKMNMPGKPASIGINAVAIDPQTAHTALADCVNNHYWLRYGTLFASSFLSGLADAISQQGSQTSTGSGGILVTHDPLNTGQTIAVALGAVGSQYASVLGSNFTRPPTVYVYDGDSIGVLFMQDLTEVPDTCCPDIDKTCNSVGGGTACMAHY